MNADTTPTARRLVTADVIAEQLAVPASWVLAQARAGCIPHVHLGRYMRFDPDAITAWWQARTHNHDRRKRHG